MSEREYALIREALLSAHKAMVRCVYARSRKAQIANGRIVADQLEFALSALQSIAVGTGKAVV